MDGPRFDAATRALGATMSRRSGIAAAVALALRAFASQPAAALGPCGNGSPKDNACKKNGDCCTKYCVKGTCKCKPKGMACARNAHCCSGTCKNGTCAASGGGGGGGKCGPANCDGCCDGATCRAGTANGACGKAGAPCASCGASRICKSGTCSTLKICGFLTCRNGCCEDGACKLGTSPLACGADGASCAVCKANAPFCLLHDCAECRGNGDCDSGFCFSGICQTLQSEAVFGTVGEQAADMYAAAGIDISPSGNTIWVADTGNDRISVWDRTPGGWVHRGNFGSTGDGLGKLSEPRGVWATRDTETVFVADTGNDRISVWNKVGNGWANIGDFGSGVLRNPTRVATSDSGDIVVITELNRTGAQIWFRNGDTWTFSVMLGSRVDIADGTTGVWVSRDSRQVFLSNAAGDAIARWLRSGASWSFVESFASPGFDRPRGVAVDGRGQTAWTTSAIAQARDSAVAFGQSDTGWNVRHDILASGGGPLKVIQDIAVSEDGGTVAFVENRDTTPRVHVYSFA